VELFTVKSGWYMIDQGTAECDDLPLLAPLPL
jgi:hypothetical protein